MRTVPAENFVQTLHVNVDNEKLNDEVFRQLVRNTLPIVQYEVPKHRVIQDTAGFSCLPRLTCTTPGCQGATLVRQPCMTDYEWELALAEFKEAHPHEETE